MHIIDTQTNYYQMVGNVLPGADTSWQRKLVLNFKLPLSLHVKKERDRFTRAVVSRLVYQKIRGITQCPAHYVGRKDAIPKPFL